MATEVGEWYKDQYKKLVNIEPYDNLQNFPAYPPDSNALTISGLERMESFIQMKYRYPISSDGYICSMFSITIDNVKVNYAYAYWRISTLSEDSLPEYLCISPTFESRDGEYRNRFILYNVFDKTFELASKHLEKYERAVLELMESNVITLDCYNYPSTYSLEEKIDNQRLPVKTLTVALMLDLYKTKMGISMIHTKPEYIAILETIIDHYPELAIYDVYSRKLATALAANKTNTLKCGQKIVPLYAREVMQFNDYNLSTWREVLVAQCVSDLVLNFITPSFPLFNNWMYVDKVDSSIFENAAMIQKYVRSAAVVPANEALKEVRHKLKDAASVGPPSYKIEELDAHVLENLHYSQSHLKLSQVALIQITEVTGVTLHSLGIFARRQENIDPSYTNAYSTADLSAKHIFEYVYAAHCMHVKLGVAHTDLHSGNLTLYRWGSPNIKKNVENKYTLIPYYDRIPSVLYLAGLNDETDAYVFPATGDCSGIIDFSRTILGPGFRHIIENEHTEQYATNFYRDQVNSVMRALHMYAPDFVEKNQEALKAATIADFETVFPVLCAIDFIAIGRTVGAVLKLDIEAENNPDKYTVRTFHVNKKAIELAESLELESRNFFMAGLNHIVHKIKGTLPSDHTKRLNVFPGEILIKKIFKHWSHEKWSSRQTEGSKLVDAYNFKNEVTYSGQDYSKFPPWAQIDKIIPHLGQYKIEEVVQADPKVFFDALGVSSIGEILADRTRDEEGVEEGQVSTTGSWINN